MLYHSGQCEFDEGSWIADGTYFAVGGGTKNALWLQCLADILEQEICVPAVSFGAAYGDALMAALAGGAFLDWKELSDRIQVKKYMPRIRKTLRSTENRGIYLINFMKLQKTICTNCQAAYEANDL